LWHGLALCQSRFEGGNLRRSIQNWSYRFSNHNWPWFIANTPGKCSRATAPSNTGLVLKTIFVHTYQFITKKAVFWAVHNIAHPGQWQSGKLIVSRYIFPSTGKDCTRWATCCIQCQKAKVQRHKSFPEIWYTSDQVPACPYWPYRTTTTKRKYILFNMYW